MVKKAPVPSHKPPAAKDPSAVWLKRGFALAGLLCAAGLFLYFYGQQAPAPAAPKRQVGYKADDRQKLEKLMHKGAQSE